MAQGGGREEEEEEEESEYWYKEMVAIHAVAGGEAKKVTNFLSRIHRNT